MVHQAEYVIWVNSTQNVALACVSLPWTVSWGYCVCVYAYTRTCTHTHIDNVLPSMGVVQPNYRVCGHRPSP